MRQEIRIYLQPAFLICAVVLVIGAVAMDRLHVDKVPLPLKKSFDLLDEKALAPYKLVSKEKIGHEQVVKELGTEDYIQWVLEDPDAAADSAVRKCMLFITYYELPDVVPHVPEECYIGLGHQVLASESVTFEIDSGPGLREAEKIQGRYLVFAGTNSKNLWVGGKFSVLYLFNVNGIYANSREDARWALNRHILSKYAYFSKVEWKFSNTRLGQTIYPGRAEAVAASEKLLAVILPVLEKEHWPDWPVVNGK